MVRMNAVPPETAKRWTEMELPVVKPGAWTPAKDPSAARVALISSAGLHRKSEPPFARGDNSYRMIPAETKADELFMSHVSSNYDRVGWQEDVNVAFPIDRIRELAEEGVIGAVATNHYSFMGASDPTTMQDNVMEVAAKLRGDGVDLILLSGV